MNKTSNGGTAPVVAISDLHGMLPEIPPCDLLLIAGDVCPVRDHSTARQRAWLLDPFSEWLDANPAATTVGIAGNHDFVAEEDPDLMRSLPWTYLCDESVTVGDDLIHGSPYVPQFFDWAFMEEDEDLASRWALIPDDTTILMTHGPPLAHGDRTDRGVNAGSRTLLNRIGQLGRLRLHVFGHIHEAAGQFAYGEALLVNATHVNLAYHPVFAPRLIEST